MGEEGQIIDEKIGTTEDFVMEGPEPGSDSPIDTVDYFANLDKGKRIVKEIEACKGVQQMLKNTFATRGLEGGALAALDHPLYLEAEKRIRVLQEDFTQLI